jgi:glycine/D-amino acid oxidase-like deaminating enzyme
VAVLVDAALAGRATAAGAGIICPWSSRIEDPDWYAFGCAAAREYPALIDALASAGETDTGYRHGLTIGPYAGAIAARLALGLPAGLDLSPFDPLR